jgi:hypothetical protein
VAHPCAAAAAAARARAALLAAEKRYRLEARGTVIHADLRRIAADGALTTALAAHDLAGAQAEATRQLVRHVVRIRVLSGARVLVDANAASFDVAGSSVALVGSSGARLGRLEITVQDVIGFDKLVHKLVHADVVVRSSAGRARATLAGASRVLLPASGCVHVGRSTYLVSSFSPVGFAGEQLDVSVLTPA